MNKDANQTNLYSRAFSSRAMQLSSLMLASSAAFTSYGQESLQDGDGEVYELQDFTVVSTGTRTERLLIDVPIKTEVLGSDIFESAAITELGQALELLNGARTEANCQNCGTAEIQLLGLPGNYNQILVDGLPLFTGVAAVYGIDQVPTIAIDRMEIVKGGGSALYGPGAVAGVVNLIPEEPYESHTHIDSTFRSTDGESPIYQSQFASYYVNEDGSFKASLYGLYSDQNEYDRDGDGFTEMVERENRVIGTNLWWTPTDRTRLRGNYQYIGEERRGGDSLGKPEKFAQVAEALDTDYHWATLAWDQQLADDWSMTLSAAMVDFQRDSYYGGTGGEIIDPASDVIDYNNQTVNGGGNAETEAFFGNPTDGTGGGAYNSFGQTDTRSYIFDAKFQYDAGQVGETGEHRFVFGFQYETEAIKDDQLNAEGDFLAMLHDDSFSNLGFFLQDEWQINDRLEIVPGIRIDKANTLDNWVFSPRIAARYTASDTVTLRSNLSSGFLAPRVFDEDIHIENIGGTPRDIVNADDLKEERSYTFALGLDYSPAAFQGRLKTSVQAYYTILKDSFDLDESTLRIEGGREKIDRVNTDGSTIFGIELDAAYQFNNNWSANAGLAFSQARYDEEDADRGTDHYNKTPDWTGLVQLNYDNDDLFDAYLALKWTGEMYVDRLDSVTEPGVEKSPQFFVVDLGISKKFEFDSYDLTLRAGINNVLDAYQDDQESGFERDPGYVYGPRTPRTFILGARIDF
ncbi:TonB-dependent receptor [Coraliomargarita algicola]|uniref:TonB-dependent receptor n=1 Tax=Coraliomargarita algicola TaxID=3092156 RepID=A0ABZ0RFL6_9BACT|nr:TonB-dependent receptor [Coraliomargarita sp. J2-16]WPJ94201.1 TonB-dependent receptor [Coraliomargarita sp. J2-16]